MLRFSLFVFLFGVLLNSGGCNSTNGPSGAAATTVAEASATRIVEAGCASCIFGKEGAEGCQLAVSMDDKTYLVEGADIDAHRAGLCRASKKAKVAGRIEGEKFVATTFELQE